MKHDGQVIVGILLLAAAVSVEGLHPLEDRLSSRARKLQDEVIGNRTIQDLNQLPCNSVLAVVSTETIKTILTDAAGDLASILFSRLVYDVQVRKVCASCQDAMPYRTKENTEAFDSFCGSDVYGSQAIMSGVAAFPLKPLDDASAPSDTERSILPGQLKTVFIMHPTEANLAPTIRWELYEQTDLFVVPQLIPASKGNFVLFPDYLGYGESVQEVFKAYGVRTGYVTSSLPLWYKARSDVASETNCETSLGDGVAITGYSEGGYSSVALSDALSRLGVNVLDVRSGAGPLSPGSVTLLRFIEGIDQGTLPARRRSIVVLFSAAYSSTYSGIPNYQKGQDMLVADRREVLIELAQNSLTDNDLTSQIAAENYLETIISQDYLDFLREMIFTNNDDPCNTLPLEELQAKRVNLVCEALQESDLVNAVKSATYPLEICHSAEDEVVHIDNVPDFDTFDNDNVSFRSATGTHNEAGATCIFSALIYLSSDQFLSIEIPEDAMCGEAPVQEPVMPPVSPPVAEPADSSATSMKCTLSAIFVVAVFAIIRM